MFWKKKNKRKIIQNNNLKVKDSALILDYLFKTDTGLVRDNNEDAVKCINFNDKNKGFLAMVADGMGGHKFGEIASQMATDIIPKLYFEYSLDFTKSLKKAYEEANRKILEKSNSNSKYSGMGTTCTTIVINNNKMYFAHVGDSRLYLYRNGNLIQLSKDQTLVQKMIDKGTLTKLQAKNYPQKNVIWQALGTKKNLEVQLSKKEFTLYENDRLLLCSDGLTDMVEDMEINQIMQLKSLSMIASCLIALAKDKGGYDNISVALIQIDKYHRGLENKNTREVF